MDVSGPSAECTGSKKRGYFQSSLVSSAGFGTLTTSTLKTALLSLTQRWGIRAGLSMSYGGLVSLGAWKGLFKLQRTDACIDCKKCEKVCPTDEAKREDAKAECYLCGRCMDVCPMEGALTYRR